MHARRLFTADGVTLIVGTDIVSEHVVWMQYSQFQCSQCQYSQRQYSLSQYLTSVISYIPQLKSIATSIIYKCNNVKSFTLICPLYMAITYILLFCILH